MQNAERLSERSWKTTLILAVFFGMFGVHRFYTDKTGSGTLYLFTAGLCGYGWLFDIILIVLGRFRDGDGALIVKNPSENNFKQTVDSYYPYYNGEASITKNIPRDSFPQKTNHPHISSADGMEGHRFELFCSEILRRHGFSDIKLTPGSGDQGVDILAVKDSIRYAIQCKNYASPLGNKPVQEVHAGKAFYNCHVGVVMTNSTFTRGAVELANATGVLLWDRGIVQKMINSSTAAG